MLIVNVHIQVKPDMVEQFIKATIKNASNSIKEPGVARFDLIQKEDSPEHFILVEIYKYSEAPAEHKDTIHYKEWRTAVGPMMAKPREGLKHINIFPEDSSW